MSVNSTNFQLEKNRKKIDLKKGKKEKRKIALDDGHQ
jgi:hypothetical protein